MEAQVSIHNCNELIQKLEEPQVELIDLEKDVSIQLDRLFQDSKVPILSNNDDVPYEKVQFKHILQVCCRNLALIEQILGRVLKKLENEKYCASDALKASCANCIVVAAQYNNEERDWSTQPASKIALNILSLLLLPIEGVTGWGILEGKLRKLPTIDDEVSKNSGSTWAKSDERHATKNPHNYRFGSSLKSLLSYISTHFTKSLWKNDPGCQELLLWLLYTLPPDDLSEHIGGLMPGILLMLDDWETRHKIPALKALLFIINNIAGSELRCYGRASVIYEAAKHHIYSRDPNLLEAAYPAATAAASVLQQDAKCVHSAQLSAPEEVLSMLLKDMAFEQRLDLRAVYIASLPAALVAAAVRSLRWQGEVVQVLCSYITTYEGPSASDRLTALKALQVYCEHCWAQAGRRRLDLLKAIAQLVYSCSAKDDLELLPQVQEAVMEESRKCVQLLMRCKPDPHPTLLAGMLSLDLPCAVQANIVRVFGECRT